MRILHLTDTHLGARQSFVGAPGGGRRADDRQAALERALAPVEAGEVELVIHSGDVFDRSHPPARAVAQALATLSAAARQVPVVLLRGNHDRWGLTRSLPTGRVGLHIVDEASQLDLLGLRLALAPFRRHAESWAADAARAWGGGADLLVCHQAFDGAQVPGLTFRVGAQRETVGEAHLPRGVGHVLCGHIHPRQAIRVGGALVVHPGALTPTSFVEAGQPKGMVRWELGRRIQWRFEEVQTRPLLQLHSLAEVHRVQPGSLVRIPDDADLQEAVRARGGWCAPRWRSRPAVPGPQLSLFG